MKKTQTTSYKWAYLPFVFSSAALLATSVSAGPAGSQQYQPARQVNSVNHEYVGGRTQAGFSVTDDGDVGVELNHVFSETQNSSTSGGLWADYDLDDKEVGGRGAQINHNWVSRDRAGRVSHVNKLTAAYDRNAAGHDKATVGYGQERENIFWEGHVSKGLSGSKNSKKVGNRTVSDKAYDYGVGASVGTFLKGSNVRVRAGLDHEWGDDVGAGESTAKNTTLSAGIEKFFQGTPHSLGLDIAASKRSGGYDNGSDDTDVSGRLTYRYDFGGASIYQPDRRYKRVRVEVPGRAIAPRYAQKRTFKRVPTYKSVPTYGKKTVRKPYKQLIKSTMALEGQTFFKLNSAKLIPSAQTRLKQIATEIRRNGYKGSIRITGNTCGLGNPVYDQRLSEQRARAVRAFLIKNGFNAKNLIARGLGKGHPKYPNTPDQGFKNRRVDIEYVTERKAYKTGYRTETQTVRTGTRRVATGFKNVPAGTKNVMISSGRPGAPRVIWKTQVIPTSPAWIKRALHNNIKHNRSVNTYTSTDSVVTKPTPVIPLPKANNDSVELETCNSTVINVLDNDKQGSGNATVSVTGNPAHGNAVVQADGSIKYTPNDDYVGNDSFTYTITDSRGKTSTATVNVKVTGQCQSNTAPVAVNDSTTTAQGQMVALDTLANDRDADGDTLTITSVANPAHGTAEIVAGQIIYTPNAGFVGTERFQYTISDGNGNTSTATETVIVKATAATNRAPVAINDSATTITGQMVALDTLANDSDADGDKLTITSVARPAHGTAEVVGGQIVYTPDHGFLGTERFQYTISDGKGNTATAIETVIVRAEPRTNVAPIAKNDTASATCDAITIKVLANDTDRDGDALSIIGLGDPSLGTAVIKGNTIVYTPVNSCGTGVDTFSYTISDGHGHTATANVKVNVNAHVDTNVAPVAKNDRAVAYCDAVTINVLDNDWDADEDTLTITGLGDPSLGTAVIDGNTVVYTPVNSCGTGTDTFTYTISDGNGHTTKAKVKVDVKGDGSDDECKTDCEATPINVKNDTATTKQGKGIIINVLDNDDSGLMIVNVSSSAHGYAEAMNGKIIYTPNSGFSGKDTFTYTVKDAKGQTAQASVTVTVKKDVVVPPKNVAPVANEDAPTTTKDKAITIDVLANDTDADHDTLTIDSVTQPNNATVAIVNNKIRFTPKGVVGSIAFSYTVSDGHGHTDQTVVTVATTDPSSGNFHYPLITGETVYTKQGVAITIDVLANDTDADGDTLILDQVDSGSMGTTHKVNGKVLYTPIAGMVGTDEFYYGVHDGHGHNGNGKVTVIVTK